MRRALFAIATGIGVYLALRGERPSWVIAVAALLIFPLAVGAAGRAGGAEGRAPLPAALVVGLSGGMLAALGLRLAVLAPDWLNEGAVDCGGASTGAQQVVLWSGAVIFAVSALPVAASLYATWRLLGGGGGTRPTAPLNLYPLAVGASSLALVGASFVTGC
jgi:hypothetical protein